MSVPEPPESPPSQDVEIPDEAAEGIATVGDAVTFIQDKQG